MVFVIRYLQSFRKGRLVLLALGVVCAACATKGIAPLDLSPDLPNEIPDELKDKYAIKDQDAAQKDASSASPKADPKKKGKKWGAVNADKPKDFDETSEPPPSRSKTPSRRPQEDPLWVGEKQTWEITYFGMAAGDVSFEIKPFKSINRRKVYHVYGLAESSKVFSLFYRLKDTVETFFDFEGFYTHRFQVGLDEAKQQRTAIEINDSEKRQTFYWNRWNHHKNGYTETKEFAPMPPYAQDSLSALYYIRTLPLPTGKVIEFPVVSEGKSWEAAVTVVRRETLDTKIGKVKTIVIKPEHKLQGILQKSGDSFVWLTDDERRFVVRLEAKVKIGTVVAHIKSVEPGTAP